MKERAAATAKPIAHIVNTFYARVEVGSSNTTADVIKTTLRRVRQKEVGAKASYAPTESANAGSVYARVDAAATDRCVAVTPRLMPPSATYSAMSALPVPTSRWCTRDLVRQQATRAMTSSASKVPYASRRPRGSQSASAAPSAPRTKPKVPCVDRMARTIAASANWPERLASSSIKSKFDTPACVVNVFKGYLLPASSSSPLPDAGTRRRSVWQRREDVFIGVPLENDRLLHSSATPGKT
nr:uncharacterized protein LOC113816556 [Penaeus vannamei]